MGVPAGEPPEYGYPVMNREDLGGRHRGPPGEQLGYSHPVMSGPVGADDVILPGDAYPAMNREESRGTCRGGRWNIVTRGW